MILGERSGACWVLGIARDLLISQFLGAWWLSKKGGCKDRSILCWLAHSNKQIVSFHCLYCVFERAAVDDHVKTRSFLEDLAGYRVLRLIWVFWLGSIRFLGRGPPHTGPTEGSMWAVRQSNSPSSAAESPDGEPKDVPLLQLRVR